MLLSHHMDFGMVMVCGVLGALLGLPVFLYGYFRGLRASSVLLYRELAASIESGTVDPDGAGFCAVLEGTRVEVRWGRPEVSGATPLLLWVECQSPLRVRLGSRRHGRSSGGTAYAWWRAARPLEVDDSDLARTFRIGPNLLQAPTRPYLADSEVLASLRQLRACSWIEFAPEAIMAAIHEVPGGHPRFSSTHIAQLLQALVRCARRLEFLYWQSESRR